MNTMKIKRKNVNTTLRPDLIKSLKFLALKKDMKLNEILEEAISDLLNKYKSENKK